MEKEKGAEFDYDCLWNDQEEKKDNELLEEVSRGYPRSGLNGPVIKKKNYLGKNHVKYSYKRYFKDVKREDG